MGQNYNCTTYISNFSQSLFLCVWSLPCVNVYMFPFLPSFPVSSSLTAMNSYLRTSVLLFSLFLRCYYNRLGGNRKYFMPKLYHFVSTLRSRSMDVTHPVLELSHLTHSPLSVVQYTNKKTQKVHNSYTKLALNTTVVKFSVAGLLCARYNLYREVYRSRFMDWVCGEPQERYMFHVH